MRVGTEHSVQLLAFSDRCKKLNTIGLALKTRSIVSKCVCLRVQPAEGTEEDTESSLGAAFCRGRDGIYFIRVTLITTPQRLYRQLAIELREQEGAGGGGAVRRGKGAVTACRAFTFILLPPHGFWARGPIPGPSFFLCAFCKALS